MNRFSRSVLPALVFVSASALAQNNELTISSWGGVYEKAQNTTYFQPFEQEHDVRIILKPYNGGVAPLEILETENVARWDVLDMIESDALTACKNRLLAEFDRSVLLSAPDGTPAKNDFVEAALFDCGVAHLHYASVLAYDERAFPNEKPNSVADFFDIEKFPGKRAIQRTPKAILEWAMLSYNVPVRQIYDLLSTERGFKLVTRRLNQLKDHIVWWEDGQQPVNLLRDGEVIMASGFNGRFYDARINHDLPISVILDGQFLEMSAWAIHRQAQRPDLAAQFIAFATSTKRMADFSNLLPYVPTRKSAFERLSLPAESMNSIYQSDLNSELTGNRIIRADSEWYAVTEIIRNRWFNDWLNSSSD